MKSTVNAALVVILMLFVAAIFSSGAAAIYPSSGSAYPRTVWSDRGLTGSIVGKVTTGVVNPMNLSGAYIAIVNSTNLSQEYYSTTTNKYGDFAIAGINATYSSVNRTGQDNKSATFQSGAMAYKVYANYSYGDGNYSEGYSRSFGIDADNVAPLSLPVYIVPMSASISLKISNTQVKADGQDTVGITAYGYDVYGNLVGDGTSITLVVTNQTNMSEPSSWIRSNWSANNGSLNAKGQQSYTATTSGQKGSISTSFGWAPDIAGGNSSTIYAYFTNDPSINASVTIYIVPRTASWTGYVVDTDGTKYPNLPVTLHIMSVYSNNNTPYEIYNMTKTTSASAPFAGMFVFSYIILTDSEYGYVSASASLTDNLTIYGKSNNYSMNKSATDIGAIVLDIPPPDSLKVTAEKPVIMVGGMQDNIYAQLMMNGKPYHRPSQPITFSSDNDSVATLPAIKTNNTDLNGRAAIVLTSGQFMGKVNVTANASFLYGHVLTDTVMVRVVGWGTVSGIVSDDNRVGIPNANVTLWNVRWNNTSNKWENVAPYPTLENPQLTNDGRNGQTVGLYTYYRIPYDVYNVTGGKDGHTWYAMLTLGPFPTDVAEYKNATDIPASDYGTSTHNVAIPDYAYIYNMGPPAPTPTPHVPTPTPTVVPTATPTPTPKPSPGFEALFALAGLLSGAYLLSKNEY